MPNTRIREPLSGNELRKTLVDYALDTGNKELFNVLMSDNGKYYVLESRLAVIELIHETRKELIRNVQRD